MADSPNKDKKLIELQAVLSKLRESEVKCGKAAAQYAELESVFRKRLKSQIIDSAEPPSRTESNTSWASESKSINNVSSIQSIKTESKTKRRHSEKMQKVEKNQNLSRKSISDVSQLNNTEHAKSSQVQDRIRQCHESIEGINILSEKLAGKKKKFLHRLKKANSETWNSLKDKHPSTTKLRMHLDST